MMNDDDDDDDDDDDATGVSLNSRVMYAGLVGLPY